MKLNRLVVNGGVRVRRNNWRVEIKTGNGITEDWRECIVSNCTYV